MFHKTICLFIVLWAFNVFQMSPYSVNGISASLHQQRAFKSGLFLMTESQVGQGAYGGFEHKRNSENRRSKRGIILVDEDFDVPAKPGVKHGWGENEDQPKENIFETLKEKEKFETDEGSGVGDITQDSEYTKSTLPIKDIKTDKVPSSIISSATTALLITTKVEGSGDDSTSSKETTEELPIEFIPDVCLNSTCSNDEFSVDSSYDGFIPEGENLTLLCAVNQSVYDKLYTTLLWYRINGSMYNLQTMDRYHELRYNMLDVKVFHSGTYLCVKWESPDSCCHKELFITIYEVPAYQYHLIIIGLITAACLITCIFLGIWRSIALKKYTEQFAKMQSNQKPLLI